MSTYNVVIAPEAIEDVRSICSYVSEELGAPNAAERIHEGILAEMRALSRFPMRNRVLFELPDGRQIRRARLKKLYILYFVEQESVKIFSVVHGNSATEKRLARLADRIG